MNVNAPLKIKAVHAALGPDRTSLAQALSDFVQKTIPFKKGAAQELIRANKYLRSAGLATFKATKVVHELVTKDSGQHFFTLTLVPPQSGRVIPKGLDVHRKKQAARSSHSDKIRGNIAKMSVADIQPYHLQALIDQLQTEKFAPSTIHLERALLREFFNYTRRTWRWPQPASNPASDVRMPKVDNARSRVLSESEQERLEDALKECKNPYILSCIALLIETTMRQSELITTSTWGDLDVDARILHLKTAKAGGRPVPLTKHAIELLLSLPRGENHAPIFPISLEALKAAWNRAVERAGIENLTLHDLRHTGATRLAIRLNGNIFLLQLATGHKTLSQLQRYVNLTALDAVAAFDSTEPNQKVITADPTFVKKVANGASEAPTNIISLALARSKKAI